jgi:hypothetical protein
MLLLFENHQFSHKCLGLLVFEVALSLGMIGKSGSSQLLSIFLWAFALSLIQVYIEFVSKFNLDEGENF